MTTQNAPPGVEETSDVSETSETSETPETPITPAPAPAFVTKAELEALLLANSSALLEKLIPPPKEPEPVDPDKLDPLAEVARMRAEVDNLRAENVKSQRINELLKHGLEDESFLPSILAAYDGREDFKAFSARISQHKAYKGFFASADPAAPKTNVPAAPGTGRAPPSEGAKSTDAQIKAEAERFYPGDKRMQQFFINNKRTVLKEAQR